MSEGHSHDHGAAPKASKRVRTILAVALAPFFLATGVGIIVLWPSESDRTIIDSPQYVDTSTVHDAVVVYVETNRCPGQGAETGDQHATSSQPQMCLRMRAQLTDGPEAGQTVTLPPMSLGGITPVFREGDGIALARTVIENQSEPIYNYADLQRRAPLLLLAAMFVAIVIGIARLRGFSALVGLGITLLILVKFMLPAILTGENPIAVALVGASASMIVILYLTHGVNARTATALVGTLVSLLITAALAAYFLAAARITGQAEEEQVTLALAGSEITITGLLLAGIIIGALGVLNDVTVTQASAVWELHRANPNLGGMQLYRSVMRIGRDHIASVVDTLVLAYAGASLPLLVLFAVAARPLGTIVNGEIVAVEIVRTLVGSIGLVLSVPITTALAAVVVARSRAHRELESGDAESGATDEPSRDRVRLATRQAQARLKVAAEQRRTRRESNKKLREDSWEPPAAERDFWTEE
jgi:uncharacterized membrane protein